MDHAYAPAASRAPASAATPVSSCDSPAGTPAGAAKAALKERRIKDAASARALWGKLRTASVPRREKWAQIQNQLDGAPPFANADLLASGQGWRCNVNFRDAASTLEQVLVSYWRLLHDATNLAAVTVQAPGDPHAERWAQLFQENFNRFNEDWGADYVRNYLLFSLNHVAFGVGLAFWNDKASPRWEALRIGEVEVPARAKASVEKLKLVGIRQEMELEDLWELVRTPEKRAAAARVGWSPEEIEKLLGNAFLDRQGDRAAPLSAADALDLQRLLRNDALGASTGHEPLRLVHLLVRDYDGRITRHIFCESAEDNDRFLFCDEHGERPADLTQVLGAVFFDAGNGDWWGTKGFGQKNFQCSTVLNRLKSRAVDRTLIDGLNFIDTTEGGRETVPITNVGPFNILPQGLQQLPQYPTGRSILETIEMIESNQAQHNARYRDQSHQIARADTATQASILANLQSQVDIANATLYLRQVARNIFAEQFRRLRLRRSASEDAKAFFRRCVTEGGMPETVFHDAELTVRTGAEPGATNLMLQGQRALELLSLPEANRRWAQERYVAATFGAGAVAKALLPVDAAADVKSQRLALMENSDMGEGSPLPVDPQDAHAAHAPVHLQPLEAIVHNYGATGRLDPTALVALQHAVPHLEAHFAHLARDKFQAALHADLWPRFAAVRAAAEGMFRLVERMHQQAQAQAAAPADGGVPGAAGAEAAGVATPQPAQ